MLKLEQTEKILRGLVDAGWMGSYALLVRHGSEKAAITGKNVDADTLFEVASLTDVYKRQSLYFKLDIHSKRELFDIANRNG